jgi:hypothetical protein
MESICGRCSKESEKGVGGELSGQAWRHASAKREFRESRMQTARAMVSSGRSARVRIAWTRGTDGVVREVEEGIRFVRWMAGPRSRLI